MNRLHHTLWLFALLASFSGCGGTASDHDGSSTGGSTGHGSMGHESEAEPPRGPHGGRLLADGEFSLELAIFETGVPPEFRAWAIADGMPVLPGDVDLDVTLTRLGDVRDEIAFAPQDDFLRGDTVVYEPHSFVVAIEARHDGRTYRWEYDNFEGRTHIGQEIAAAFGLATELAGPATIRETVAVYGRVVPNRERVRSVSARFDGVIDSVDVSIGDTVREGQTLAVVESNDSLESYSITAPIDGILTRRVGNPGEQTGGRTLFTIVDTASVWAELAVFPSDRTRVRVGAKVTVRATSDAAAVEGTIAQVSPIAEPNQAVTARVVLDNADGAFAPGMYVTSEIEVAEYAVPLAVRREGLQGFRDFTVVYAQIGDEYEVRMLELGRQDGEWVEVLGGLAPGTRYVTTNSYLVKADIEKSGASHDH